MKIKESIEKIIEGNPKCYNSVYINTSNKIELANFATFENILFKFVKINKIRKNIIDKNNMIYEYEIKLRDQRKFMYELNLQALDLRPKCFSLVELVHK